eukprot:2166542-Alexandrium_andersonii.AAC.1
MTLLKAWLLSEVGVRGPAQFSLLPAPEPPAASAPAAPFERQRRNQRGYGPPSRRLQDAAGQRVVRQRLSR